MEPQSVAASIYQAFILRLARSSPELRSAIATWPSATSTAPTTGSRSQHVAVALAGPSARPLGGGGRGSDRATLGRARARRPAARRSTTSATGSVRSGGLALGQVHRMEFPHALGGANPLLRRLLNRSLPVGGAQETVAQIAYDPNDPYRAVWAPSWRMVADPSIPIARAGRCSPASRGIPPAAISTTCSRAGCGAIPSRWRARALAHADPSPG